MTIAVVNRHYTTANNNNYTNTIQLLITIMSNPMKYGFNGSGKRVESKILGFDNQNNTRKTWVWKKLFFMKLILLLKKIHSIIFSVFARLAGIFFLS